MYCIHHERKRGDAYSAWCLLVAGRAWSQHANTPRGIGISFFLFASTPRSLCKQAEKIVPKLEAASRGRFSIKVVYGCLKHII